MYIYVHNCPCNVDLFSKYLEIRIRTRQNDHLFLLCSKRIVSHFTLSAHMLMLLMEEILHHLGCIKPCKSWDKLYINWCRISSINSMNHVYRWNARGQVASSPFEFRPVQRNCQGGANLAPASKTDLLPSCLANSKKNSKILVGNPWILVGPCPQMWDNLKKWSGPAIDTWVTRHGKKLKCHSYASVKRLSVDTLEHFRRLKGHLLFILSALLPVINEKSTPV